MVILITKNFEQYGKEIASEEDLWFTQNGKTYSIEKSSIPLMKGDFIVYSGAQEVFGHPSREDFVIAVYQDSSSSSVPVKLKTERVDPLIPEKLETGHYKILVR